VTAGSSTTAGRTPSPAPSGELHCCSGPRYADLETKTRQLLVAASERRHYLEWLGSRANAEGKDPARAATGDRPLLMTPARITTWAMRWAKAGA